MGPESIERSMGCFPSFHQADPRTARDWIAAATRSAGSDQFGREEGADNGTLTIDSDPEFEACRLQTA